MSSKQKTKTWMKTLVIASQADLEEIRHYLESHPLEEPAYHFALAESLTAPLNANGFDLIIIKFHPVFAEKQWFYYLAGFVEGRGIPGFLLLTPHSPTIVPDWVDSSILRLTSRTELTQALERSLNLWRKRESKKQAELQLTERGFYIIPEELCERIDEGDLPETKLFIKTGFSPDTRDKKGVPLLCHAARYDHLILIKYLVEQGADPNIISEDRGNTPLLDASSAGYDGIVHYLLSQNADPDTINKSGQTALIVAVGSNHTQAAVHLIKSGANVSITDSLGMSAGKYAALFSNKTVLDLL